MISKAYTYAIVGASNNPQKFGNIVLKDLKSAGFNVIPVNLHEEQIEGLQVYKSLSDIPGKVDVVVTIVPSQVTLEVIEQAKQLGIGRVWMQPGSENQQAVEVCEQAGIKCSHHACIMVERKLLGY
jgi:predicted CoA-binding protein